MQAPTPDLVAQMLELINFRDRGAATGLIHLWQSLIRDAAYLAGSGDGNDLVNVDFRSEIESYAPRLANPQLVQQMVNTTKNTLADLRLNVHIQPALVAMALKLKKDMETAAANAGS